MKTRKLSFFFVLLVFFTNSVLTYADPLSVLFVTDPASTQQSNTYIEDYCQSNGYTINKVLPTDTNLATLYATADIVIIGNQAPGDATTVDAFKNVIGSNPLKPFIFCKSYYAVAYNLVSSAGFNSSTGYSMTMNNSSHPLAAGKSGVVEVYDFPEGVSAASGSNDKNVWYLRYNEVAPSAVIIGTNAVADPSSKRVALCGFEAGYTLLNSVVNNNRMVFFYFSTTNTSVCVYNTHTDDLWDATFNWTLAGQPLTTSFKTEDSKLDYRIEENVITWESGNYSVAVYNSVGQEIFKKTDLSASNVLDLNHFTSGVYVVRYIDKQSTRGNTFKFIKR
jgi:hypothetical protein